MNNNEISAPHIQVVEDGYEFFAKRQLVTLFSAPNYCGEFDNAGGMMSVDETLMCSFQVGALRRLLGPFEYYVTPFSGNYTSPFSAINVGAWNFVTVIFTDSYTRIPIALRNTGVAPFDKSLTP